MNIYRIVKVKQNDAFAIIAALSLYRRLRAHQHTCARRKVETGGNKMCKEIIFNLDRAPVWRRRRRRRRSTSDIARFAFEKLRVRVRSVACRSSTVQFLTDENPPENPDFVQNAILYCRCHCFQYQPLFR